MIVKILRLKTSSRGNIEQRYSSIEKSATFSFFNDNPYLSPPHPPYGREPPKGAWRASAQCRPPSQEILNLFAKHMLYKQILSQSFSTSRYELHELSGLEPLRKSGDILSHFLGRGVVRHVERLLCVEL